jgi:FKBP-type peptidyl-prolyl cis-trans isomerase
MKIHIYFILGVLLTFSGLTSCKRQAPQLPSNKNIPVDTAAASLLAINQDLTHKEDSLLEIYVKSKNETFKRSELGFWYKIAESGKGVKIEDKASCSFNYKLSILDGKEIENSKKTAIIGKKQLVIGLEEGLKLLHTGDSATFIIPWYLGYGMKGNENIPPYTSLRYEVRIDK